MVSDWCFRRENSDDLKKYAIVRRRGALYSPQATGFPSFFSSRPRDWGRLMQQEQLALALKKQLPIIMT